MSLSTDITSPLTPALSGFQIAARLPAGGLRVEAGSETSGCLNRQRGPPNLNDEIRSQCSHTRDADWDRLLPGTEYATDDRCGSSKPPPREIHPFATRSAEMISA